jgi:hypothetical protein
MVGEYTAGRLVEDQVITELKVVAPLSDVHLPQSRNDLRATRKPLFLLINFGRPKAEIRRVTPPFRVLSPPFRVRSRRSLIAMDHPASSLLIPLIRLKKENLPPHSGIAWIQLGNDRQALRRIPAAMLACARRGSFYLAMLT